MTLRQAVIDRIESIDALGRAGEKLAKAVKRVTDPAPVKNVLSGTWLGHPLHPLLTDIPIGAWSSAAILDVIGGKKARPAADRLVVIGILTAAPTVASGLSDWADTYGGEQRIGVVHALANTVA